MRHELSSVLKIENVAEDVKKIAMNRIYFFMNCNCNEMEFMDITFLKKPFNLIKS